MKAALLRYRVMAYITGVGLLVLVFVALPLKYWGHNETPTEIVGQIHGYAYMLYLITVADLWWRCKWHPMRALLIAIAGTIPFLSFVAEHYVSKDVKARHIDGVVAATGTPDAA